MAVLLLMVPFPWLFGWGVAVLVHELSHCVALRLCGKQIGMVFLDMNGARIHTEDLSNWQMILCALAGPTGGLLLLPLAKIFPQATICALFLSLYNLLPVYPLDGGRALYGLMRLILPEHICEVICHKIEMFVLLSMIFLCVIAFFVWKLGGMPLLAAVLFVLRILKIKRPCKTTIYAVQ